MRTSLLLPRRKSPGDDDDGNFDVDDDDDNLAVRNWVVIGPCITISGPIISSVPISTSVPDKFRLSTHFFSWLQQLPKIDQNL